MVIPLIQRESKLEESLPRGNTHVRFASNQKGILCDGCSNWHHAKCIGLDNRTYMMLSSSDDSRYCTNCSFPFNFSDSFFEEPTEHALDSNLQASLSSDRVIADIHNNFPYVLVLNARSIRNKVSDLHTRVLTDSFDYCQMITFWFRRKCMYLVIQGILVLLETLWISFVLIMTSSLKR